MTNIDTASTAHQQARSQEEDREGHCACANEGQDESCSCSDHDEGVNVPSRQARHAE